MKWTLLAAAALVLCCGLPFRTHETRTLLPVQTVQAEWTEAGVRIVTEAGEGSGATWDDAVAALRMAAPGEVYFDTAGQVVLCGKTDRLVNELLESGILRPAAQVRRSGGLTDPEGLFDLLEAHASPVTVGLLRAEPGTALRIENLCRQYGLPVCDEKADFTRIASAITMDKKNLGKTLKIVALEQLGKGVLVDTDPSFLEW